MLIYEASTFVDHVIGYIVADAPVTFKMLVVTLLCPNILGVKVQVQLFMPLL